MTNIGFLGDLAGKTVTISATKNGNTVGPLTANSWGDAAGSAVDVGSMTITTFREPSITAPEHVRFTANVLSETGLPVRTNGDVGTATYDVYDQQMHELEFVWTFSDPTDPQPDNLLFQANSRLPTQWRSKNKAFGKYAAHVYEKPGDYTYKCEVYRTDFDAGTQTSALVARKSGTITVATVDDFYPGAQTVCIDPDGNTDEAPAGAVVFTTFQAFRDGWGAAGGDAASQNRILFRRGKTHTGWVENSYSTGRNNMTFGAYGTGARPVLDIGGAGGNVFTSQGATASDPRGYWRFIGLDIRGSWDSATETGTRDTFISLKSPINLLLFDCVFDGVEKAVAGDMAPAGTTADSSIWFYDSTILSFRDYGIQAAKTDLQWIIVRGSRMTRAIDAAGYANGGKDGSDPRNWHGPLRIAYLDTGVIQASDFYNRSGHGESAATQSNVRIGSEGGEKPWSAEFINNVFEGGAASISTSTENGGQPCFPSNCLLKHNLVIADFCTSGGMQLARGATSCIENMFIFPDIARTQWDSDNAALTTADNKRERAGATVEGFSQASAGTNLQEPLRVIGNLTFDLKNGPFSVDDELRYNPFGALVGFTEFRDNLIYEPFVAVPDTSHGPLATAATVASYNTYGGRWENKFTDIYQEYLVDQDGKTLLTPGGQVDMQQPTVGNGVAATGAMSKFDILGVERNAVTVAG